MTDNGSVRDFPAVPLHFAAGRPQLRKRHCMEGWIVFGILAFLGYGFYKSGKREGSRKGYGVGRSHGQKHR